MPATATAAVRTSPPPGRLASWSRQAVESFVAAQRILLELTAQQNALVIGIVRERVKMPKGRPGKKAARIADHTVTGLTGAGKLLLELAAGESALVVQGVKEGLHLPAIGSVVADVVQHRFEAFINMLKHLLDSVAEQVHTVVESYEHDKSLLKSTDIGGLVRRGIESFVETEKHFLDLVVEEVTEATEAGKHGRKAGMDRSKLLMKLARQGVEQFIDTQKKLLDLAIHQLEAEAETAAERAEAAKAAQEAKDALRSSLAELTQKSVQNLVTAQKSLLDLAVKPIRSVPAHTIRHAKPIARPARRKMAKAS